MHIIIIDCIVQSMMRRVKPASPCGSGVHALGHKVCLQVPLQRVEGAVDAGEARCKLSPAQVAELEAVLDAGPVAAGYADQCWTQVSRPHGRR
jgi:hypothetical protein